MLPAHVTVVVPTLNAGPRLIECLRSLARQTYRDFRVIVVDNSNRGLARAAGAEQFGASIIDAPGNIGFGEAVNRGFRASPSPLLATLNDDAAADSRWLEALTAAAENQPAAGMWASSVRLPGREIMDSAGMSICSDGSSKQRGHGRPPCDFAQPEEVLLPSGSAAMYRRNMLDEIGLFDGEFFLYCEDTDLGLRARWAGWACWYVPDAVVEHAYSQSAGAATPLKAYFVERNRLFVVAKNFPLRCLPGVLPAAAARYLWHAVLMCAGRGAAARFRGDGHGAVRLVWYIARAHAALLRALPSLIARRRSIRATARLSSADFRRLLRRFSISPREVAAL